MKTILPFKKNTPNPSRTTAKMIDSDGGRLKFFHAFVDGITVKFVIVPMDGPFIGSLNSCVGPRGDSR